MRPSRIVAVIFLCAAAATAQNSPEALQQLSADFWKWRAATQPFNIDDIPRLERPGGHRDWSAAAVTRQRAELGAFDARYQRFDARAWPVHDQVDYRLVGSALARVRWEFDVLRRWERDPMFYVEQSLTALFEALTVPAPYNSEQSQEILQRLRDIPGTMAAGKQNLKRPPQPFAELAIASLAGVRAKLTAMAHALRPDTTLSEADLNAATDAAATALESYRAWLQQLAPALPKETDVGRDAYLFFLRKVALLPYTPEELLTMGRQEWERVVAFEQYERARNAGVAPLTIAPSLEAQSARTAANERAIREFLERKRILSVPDWVAHYTVGPIPQYLQPLADFGELDDFTSPARLTENSIRYLEPPSSKLGFFWVASAKDPRPDLVHEGVPGHYFQLALSWKHPDAIRRHYYDSGANEGLGFYAEEMMLQAGLFDDSPHTRELIYSFARLRALRVEVDVKLALGVFDIERAAEYLERTVPMDRATARHEAAFFATGPGQAITYQIGKLQILKFLSDARMKAGDGFNLRAFHDSLWLNGNVPIALQRWEMVGVKDEIAKLDAR